MFNKNESVQFANSCNNCFVVFLNPEKSIEVLPVKYKYFFKNVMIFGVNSDKKMYSNIVSAGKISVAVWEKTKGFQFKGDKISRRDNNKFSMENEKFIKYLHDNIVKPEHIKILVYRINEIYHVTPGKYAGELVSIQ